MTEITTNGTLSQGVSLGADYQRGSILDHLDKLEPSTGGKYFCPVCGGNDLSIATKGSKAGAMTCHNSGCSWQSIMDVVAPLEKRGGKTKPKATAPRFKSKTQKDNDAIAAEVLIGAKVTELFYELECGDHSAASAKVALSTWCKEHGYNSYAAGQLLQEKLKTLKDNSAWDDDEKTPELLRDYRKIDAAFGDKLRFNTLFNQVELNGERFDPSMGKIEFVVDHKLKLKSGRDDIADSITKIARVNEYNPVQEYLEQCYRSYPESANYLQGFASRVLGAKDSIYNTLVCKFLISAVARIFEPGCQVDTALILQGSQGYGKSSFFRILASPDWFDDSFGNSSDKDERLKLHSAWILEWAELETVFRRKDVSAVKAFITTKVDRLRPPYGRSIEFLPRRSVFCGTTNESEFLSDPTGNRRFWIVPMAKPLDFGALAAERDRIWAAAVSLYRAGVKWHLTDEESVTTREMARQYESIDPWHDAIADWVEGRSRVSIQEILTESLRIDLHSHTKKEQLRVRAVLMRLNWQQVSNPVFYKGVRTRVWNPPEGFTPESTVSLCQNAQNNDF